MTELLSSATVEGQQQPRVRSVPAYARSAGDDAVELALAAGLDLDPWQQAALRDGLAEDARGDWLCRDVALIVARQNGKGSILEALELAGLFLFGERLILHTAHELKTAKNHYDRMKALITTLLGEKKAEESVHWRNSTDEISITIPNGNKLRFIARSTGAGRGFSANRLVLDEAMILSPETLAALIPTLSADPNAQVWYAGSAGLVTSAQLATLRERGLAGNDPDLAFMEYSAPDDADLDDPLAWAQANPALGRRLALKTIRSERKTMPEENFARERLGIWANVEGEAVISEASWTALADGNSTLTAPAYFAVDMSPERTVASIGAASRRADGFAHVEVIENRSNSAWVVDRLIGLHAAGRVASVVIDEGSAAGSLLPALEANGIPVTRIGAREYGQSCGAFCDAVEAKLLHHRGQTVLGAAIDAGRRRTLGDAWAWNRRKTTSDITPLVAVTLALHGLLVTAPPPPPERTYFVQRGRRTYGANTRL